MPQLDLLKATYSEQVIRKALYWCSEYGLWSLSENDTHWQIRYEPNAVNFYEQLHRHLNDFKLRELLDKRTGQLRYKIVDSALAAILKHVERP